MEPISLLVFLLLLSPSMASKPTIGDPTPTEWPLQFHSLIFYNRSGTLQKVDLWYDWPNGRNFNIIQDQLVGVGDILYDLEWDNGTSFYYSLDTSKKECRVMHFPVGILRPNWLDGATYLGQETVDNFLCNVWTKVDFILYYEDVLTKRPVKWIFFEGPPGYTAHVMTFEVGAVLEDPNWQAPVYSFDEAEKEKSSPQFRPAVQGGSLGSLMRWIPFWETMQL